jgi:anaerobic dimethyl sulfoxide reductase subunit A
MDSTITPSAIWADVLFPVATHFERHDVALPWYKGHYYIHRPKVIEPLGESKTDFQIFTELSYRLEMLDPTVQGMGRRYNPRADRSYFLNPDAVDEQYLTVWWNEKVMHHQHVDMSWETFKKHGIYKFKLARTHVAFQDQIEKGIPFPTPSGKIEIFSTNLASITDWKRTQYGYEIPAIPKWIEPFESLNHPLTKKFPFHLITPHPRERTHSIYHNIPWLRETCSQEVTLNASDAKSLGVQTGDTVEVYNDRGSCIVPVYVTERCMPRVAVIYEGAWMDRDKNGIDRAGNPDFLTADQPSPAGAFAYNTILVNIRKTELVHRPGWDQLANARSHVFRRES